MEITLRTLDGEKTYTVLMGYRPLRGKDPMVPRLVVLDQGGGGFETLIRFSKDLEWFAFQGVPHESMQEALDETDEGEKFSWRNKTFQRLTEDELERLCVQSAATPPKQDPWSNWNDGVIGTGKDPFGDKVGDLVPHPTKRGMWVPRKGTGNLKDPW